MEKNLLVGYIKCSTCRKAMKWLEDNQIEYNFREITVDNPSKKELKEWISKSGLSINKFFNTSGKIYRENNIKDQVAKADENTLLELLASNGMLVKRPILVAPDFVLVGFKESDWSNKLQ